MTSENETKGAVLVTAMADGEEYLLARETGSVLVRAFDGLTRLQQEAFEMVRLEGLSYQRAAATLAVSVPSVRIYVHRAYVTLRAAVSEHAPANDNGRYVKPTSASLDKAPIT